MPDAIVDELLDDGHGRAPEPLDYTELVRAVKSMPKTWYPGLLVELVRAAYKRGGIFKPNGASLFVKMKCEDKCESS